MNPAWVDADAERESFEDLAAKLYRQDGAALTAAEYKILLRLVHNRPPANRSRGRPPLQELDKLRVVGMSIACNKRVAAGASVEDAVAATARTFGVSKATVRKARQRY